MLTEHSAGAIIFKKERGEFLFLVLRYEEGHWGAAKGHVERGESLEQTALREIREETSLTELRLISGYKTENHYVYRLKGELSSKTVTFFLAEALSGEVNISPEHVGFAWLPFTEALLKVTFKSEKEVWQAGYDFLIKS